MHVMSMVILIWGCMAWGQVAVPEQLQKELKAAMEKAGIPVPETEERWQQALAALKVALQATHSCSHLPCLLFPAQPETPTCSADSTNSPRHWTADSTYLLTDLAATRLFIRMPMPSRLQDLPRHLIDIADEVAARREEYSSTQLLNTP